MILGVIVNHRFGENLVLLINGWRDLNESANLKSVVT